MIYKEFNNWIQNLKVGSLFILPLLSGIFQMNGSILINCPPKDERNRRKDKDELKEALICIPVKNLLIGLLGHQSADRKTIQLAWAHNT